MKKYILATGFLLFSLNCFALYETTGQVKEVRVATYWVEACVQINNSWFYFNASEPNFNFMKSMLLLAYSSNKSAYAASGNTAGNKDRKCDHIDAYPLTNLILK